MILFPRTPGWKNRFYRWGSLTPRLHGSSGIYDNWNDPFFPDPLCARSTPHLPYTHGQSAGWWVRRAGGGRWQSHSPYTHGQSAGAKVPSRHLRAAGALGEARSAGPAGTLRRAGVGGAGVGGGAGWAPAAGSVPHPGEHVDAVLGAGVAVPDGAGAVRPLGDQHALRRLRLARVAEVGLLQQPLRVERPPLVGPAADDEAVQRILQ